MSRLDHLSLLKFLSKPHFVHEVAEHYGISKKLASFHLRKAVKSGRVLISEEPFLQTSRSSSGRLRRFRGFLYVSRRSPMLVDGWARFRMREANDSISKPKGDVSSVRFLSKTHGSLGGGFDHKLSGFTFEVQAGSPAVRRHFKTKGHLTSEFDVHSAKVKLADHRTVDQLLRHRPMATPEEAKSLTHAERLRMFQALLKEPLPFMDIHGRFGVSKEKVRRLVKNGLLRETWASKGVGVRFELTKKGKIHLRELEAAAKYEPEMKEKNFIRLKHRASV